MDARSSAVQRKLEFKVKKTAAARNTRLKQRNQKKEGAICLNESPRKRSSDDENENILKTVCSPTKRQKDAPLSRRRGETPTRGNLRVETPTRRKLNGETPTRRSIRGGTPTREVLGTKVCHEQQDTEDTINEKSLQDKENTPVKIKQPSRERVKALSSPMKKPVLQLQKQESQIYHKAKQSFHTAKPERLIGREKEVDEINSFVKNHVTQKTSGSLYISGAPGTGKTASLSHILDNIKASHSCKSLYLNCMTLKDSATVYGKLYTDLTGKTPPSAKDRLRSVEKSLSVTGPSIIMVLDEIDQLDSKNQEILYTIFEWPSLPNSRLVLIGIANALDLTDRVLPRLQARPNCKPQLLNFAPYSKDQIAAILKDRLQKLEESGSSIMEPSAVQFCARKISAVAGDMRKALDVCRRAIEMVEHEVKAQQILRVSTSDCCNNSSQSQSPTTKKIGVMQISKVLSEVYGSSSVTTNQESIPLQQKLIVCTLLLMVKMGKLKEVTLGKLHDTYTKVCKNRQMAAVDYSEYQGIVNLLETRGIMGIKKVKDGRMAKVSLKLDEKELEHTLQDKVLMSSILHDGVPK